MTELLDSKYYPKPKPSNLSDRGLLATGTDLTNIANFVSKGKTLMTCFPVFSEFNIDLNQSNVSISREIIE